MAVFRYINALSLDVVAGALICSLFFAQVFEAELPVIVLITLALAVWSVYTIDHLWDAYRSQSPAVTFRHRFHKQHHLWLKVVLTLAIISGTMLFWYLPGSTRKLGALLSMLILAYFLTIKMWAGKPLYHKEIVIAIIYSSGVLLGPYSLKQVEISAPHILCSGQLTILAFINLLVFSYFEAEADRQQNFSSLSQSIGAENTRYLIIALIVLLIMSALTGYFIWSGQPVIKPNQIIIALMTMPTLLILNRPDYFKQKDRYRILGDATFYIPLLVL